MKKTARTLPHVTGRGTKPEDKIGVENLLPIPDDLLIKGLASNRSQDHPPIRLKLMTSRNDLERLLFFAQGEPEIFVVCLENGLALPSTAKAKAEGLPRVTGRGRQPDASIGIENLMQLPDGPRIGEPENWDRDLLFKLSTTREDLARLLSFARSDATEFVDALWEFANPGLDKIEKKFLPRGKDKDFAYWLWARKASLSVLYCLFKRAGQMAKQPVFLQKILAELDKRGTTDDYKDYRWDKLVPDPLRLAGYCVEKWLERVAHPLSSLGLKSIIGRIENDGDGLKTVYHRQIKGWESLEVEEAEDIRESCKDCVTPDELDALVQQDFILSDLLKPYLP